MYNPQEDDTDALMTGHQLRIIQNDLGLSDNELVDLLGFRGENATRDLRKYKTGRKEIPGTMAFAMFALQEGFRPPWAPAR